MGAVLVVILLFVMGSQNATYTTTAIPPPVIHSPAEYINPHAVYDYYLQSPGRSADLQQILIYLLQRGTYVDTGEPFSDSVMTALKTASRWNLSATTPPVWYYHSWDNLHNYQLIYNFEYGAWSVKPAL
jgi:hypothetical protein